MQTFLPYQSFTKSLECLDNKRLGKQRVEAMQILNALEPGSESRWRNHPAVRMWRGWESCLRFYHDRSIIEWVERGFNNRMKLKWFKCDLSHVLGYSNASFFIIETYLPNPLWLTEEFCSAHRSNLLRKDYEYYKQFGWSEPNDLSYIWPV